MLTNFHTHTTFCDGKNTVDEVVRAAIDKGFSTIGFSGHAYTHFDLRYCMRDADGYIAAVREAQKKYRDKIDILLGTEEDMYGQTDRSKFDYVIGSAHYVHINGKYFSVDHSIEEWRALVDAFDGNVLAMAEAYYREFCNYILARKPDIVGHFDLLTKFEEVNPPVLLNDERYHQIAERYLRTVARSGCLFEVNTGAISRGYRTAPYPHERLLRVLLSENAGVILSSDSHSADTLDFRFDEAKRLLKDVGFHAICTLSREGVKKLSI